MTIEAEIILGSEYNQKRITTFELKYPRFIHSEFMTHRVFSRNSASSRAIPVEKMLKNIWNDMAEPIHWGKNQSGMQANEELSLKRKRWARRIWRIAGYGALGVAWLLNKVGAHKQIINRVIEPWSHITVIMTSTDLENFFDLRYHKDAQPEIYELARQMHIAVVGYQYKELEADEWHLPYVNALEKNIYSLFEQIQISVARCARVSYLTHDGKISKPENDIKLYNRLVGSVPLHASPTEHQAKPITVYKMQQQYEGNFRDFIQFRKLLEEKTYSKKKLSQDVIKVFGL